MLLGESEKDISFLLPPPTLIDATQQAHGLADFSPIWLVGHPWAGTPAQAYAVAQRVTNNEIDPVYIR